MTATHHIVTCVVPAGHEIVRFLERVSAETGIWSAFFHKSRHAMVDHDRRRPRIIQSQENDEVVILVPEGRLDEVVELCYEALGIGEPGGGMLFVTRTLRAEEIRMEAGTERPAEVSR